MQFLNATDSTKPEECKHLGDWMKKVEEINKLPSYTGVHDYI